MKRQLLLPLAIACLVPALAFASPAGRGITRRKPSPKLCSTEEPLHLQLARAVFPRENWHRFLSDASAQLTKQIADSGKGQIELAPQFADRLREQYEQLAPYEEMLTYQARLLGSQYSKAELRRLLAFYRTPLGRKSVPFLHDLMASSMQRAAMDVQNGLPGALAQLRPFVRRVPGSDADAQPGGDDQARGSGAATAEDDGQPDGAAADDKAL